jgi:hypothetical protein
MLYQPIWRALNEPKKVKYLSYSFEKVWIEFEEIN